MADSPGHYVAIISMCMAKSECFDKIGTRGKSNFENNFLKHDFGFEKKQLLMKLGLHTTRTNTTKRQGQKERKIIFKKKQDNERKEKQYITIIIVVIIIICKNNGKGQAQTTTTKIKYKKK